MIDYRRDLKVWKNVKQTRLPSTVVLIPSIYIIASIPKLVYNFKNNLVFLTLLLEHISSKHTTKTFLNVKL